MKLTGEHRFEYPAELVFERAFEPAILDACIPGSDGIKRRSDTVFVGTITRGLAAITVTMDIEVEIVDDQRPDRIEIAIEGSDNRTGSTAAGDITITSSSDDGTTTLAYEGDVNITGRIASMGERLIKRQVTKDLNTFLDNLEDELDQAE